jgi:hypothetical protein
VNRIQQIFRDHGDAYLDSFAVPLPHRKVIRAIRDCRSGACGHHVYACPDCGRQHVALSSCGNRHCPVCQHDKNADWVYRQQLRRLPCTYFMATFTLPDALRPVARAHSRELYAALFTCAADALRTLEADKRFVGCHVAGFFGVLHTWGRQLQYHPHVHFVIPGGGLSPDRQRWVAAGGHFLVHVRALSWLFRGKMKARLKTLGLLEVVPAEVWTQEWVVHCKAVGHGEHAVRYLGAYVFRVALSDSRIVAYDGECVTFKFQKVGASDWQHMTLSVFEFMRRFLAHVLPPGFVKVRHFGFLSPNFALPLQRIRELICVLYETLRDALPAVSPPNPPAVSLSNPPKKTQPLRCSLCSALMIWRCFIRPRNVHAPSAPSPA